MNRRKRPLVFYKMHSLGNDFMVIDGVTQGVQLEPAAIAEWGNRHTGIGFDQLLVIEAPTEPEADFIYRIFNADGSSAEQCGNGTRCVALLARTLELSKKDTLAWQSAAGLLRTEFASNDQIETTMTVPVLELPDIPFNPDAALCGSTEALYASFQLSAQGQEFDVTPISMGNPHGVIFCDDIFNLDVPGIGAELAQHPAFPAKANIGFCQIIDRQFVRLRVYERGTGETLACGSGACAAVVAAKLHDLVDARVKVSLPGGKLRITWPQLDQPVTMSGTATRVFRGELQI